MNESMVKINDKLVRLSEPFNPPPVELVGMHETITMIRAALRGGPGRPFLYPLLVGEPGVGKNRLVYEVARMCRKELYVFQGTADVRADELSAGARISDDVNKRLDYLLSALVTAMIRGGICFMDEIGKIREEGFGLLSMVLDERRTIQSTLLYEHIQAHPGFRFIAATNSEDLESGRIPKWLKTRLRPVIEVRYPTQEEVEGILRAHHPVLRSNGTRLLDTFWRLCRERNGNSPVTPRDSIQVFSMAINLAEDEADERAGRFHLEPSEGYPDVEEKHFRRAFESIFQVGNGRAER